MKVVICGSRTIAKMNVLTECIEKSGFEITEIVSGAARGVDFLGEIYAQMHKIPLKRFPVCMDKHGKGAGFIRNKEMVDYVKPDGGVLALWDGVSKGTASTIKLAKDAKIALKVFIISENPIKSV